MCLSIRFMLKEASISLFFTLLWGKSAIKTKKRLKNYLETSNKLPAVPLKLRKNRHFGLQQVLSLNAGNGKTLATARIFSSEATALGILRYRLAPHADSLEALLPRPLRHSFFIYGNIVPLLFANVKRFLNKS